MFNADATTIIMNQDALKNDLKQTRKIWDKWIRS
jgi:hypothetical protein